MKYSKCAISCIFSTDIHFHTICHVYRSVDWPARQAKPPFGATLVLYVLCMFVKLDRLYIFLYYYLWGKKGFDAISSSF